MEKVNTDVDPFSPIWWNVGFVSSDKKQLWDFLTEPWGRHVLCWGYIPHAKSWVFVNPTENKTTVCVIPDADFDEYRRSVTGDDVTILQVKSGQSKLCQQRILQNCTNVVARVIGIKGLAFTPMMLYKTLINNDAIVKVNPYNVSQSRSPRRRSRDKSA